MQSGQSTHKTRPRVVRPLWLVTRNWSLCYLCVVASVAAASNDRRCVNYRRAAMRRAFVHDIVWSLGTAISQSRRIREIWSFRFFTMAAVHHLGCYTPVWTTHAENLVVFITVQNLRRKPVFTFSIKATSINSFSVSVNSVNKWTTSSPTHANAQD